MRIIVNIVGLVREATPVVEWPDGWPIPHVGEEISFPRLPTYLFVRHVTYLPQGDLEGTEPYVYIVLGTTPR